MDFILFSIFIWKKSSMWREKLQAEKISIIEPILKLKIYYIECNMLLSGVYNKLLTALR